MSYQITRDADSSNDLMLAAIEMTASKTAGGPYFVEMEGEPGEVLAAGELLAYDPRTSVATVRPWQDGRAVTDGTTVLVDCLQVTLLVVP